MTSAALRAQVQIQGESIAALSRLSIIYSGDTDLNMTQNFAHFSSIIASAHSKIASIHMDLVNQLQRVVSENNQAQICPPSPGLSDSTCDMNAQKLLSEDDDFADSPILSNSNALLRAKSKNKAPVASRMKLKKAASDAPSRKPTAAFFVFQAENRLKVSEIARSFASFHFSSADEK